MSTAQKIGILSTAIISLAVYFLLGYHFERSEFTILIGCYSAVFLAYLYLVKFSQSKYLFEIGLAFRAIFILALPFLSQDFYRFIWDGSLFIQGSNPYSYVPNEIIGKLVGPHWQSLYNGMGDLSAKHYSNYPPLNQLVFAAGAFFNNDSYFPSVIVYRLILILADIGTFYYGRKLLSKLGQNPQKIYWYFLNPLLIIEVTGNLHFEGLMIFFMVAGLYFAQQKKIVASGIFMASAISTKLLPLLILPLFLRYFGWKKSVLFYIIVGVVNVLIFLPFADQHFLLHFTDSIALWFNNFEFNASFYYVARYIGFQITGYNVIGIIGKFIPILTLLFAGYLTFFKSNKTIAELSSNALYLLTFYFLISTTVHPWYILNILILAVFTRHFYAMIWTFSVILSYYAYGQNPFSESPTLLMVEYLIVLAVLIYEIISKQNSNIEYIGKPKVI